MNIEEFNYDLPEELIAQVPIKDRDKSRLLVMDKNTHQLRPKMKKVPCWLVDIMIPSKHIINDSIYDLDSIQQKYLEDEDTEEDKESVVNNNEEFAPEAQQ